jgi:hypothetical protein
MSAAQTVPTPKAGSPAILLMQVILTKQGISTDILRKVKNTHEETINCKKMNKGWSLWFEMGLGVQVYYHQNNEQICNEVRKKMEEVDLKAFIYLNDIMRLGEDVKKLEARQFHWKRVSKEYRLEINLEKTVMLKLKKWRKKYSGKNKWKMYQRSR